MIEYCLECKKRHDWWAWKSYFINGQIRYICSKHFKPARVEFVPQYIKDDRKKYAKDILQPWRGGYPSKEFMEAYPKKAKKMFTEKERKNAQYVWSDLK